MIAPQELPLGPDGKPMDEVRLRNIDQCVKEFRLESSKDDFINVTNALANLQLMTNEFLANKEANLAADPEFPEQLDALLEKITNLEEYKNIVDGVAAYGGTGGGEKVRAQRTYENMVTRPIEFLIEHIKELKKLAAGNVEPQQTEAAQDNLTLEIGPAPERGTPDNYDIHFRNEFVRMIDLCITARKPEKAREVVQIFLDRADLLQVQFLQKNGAWPDEISGLFKTLLWFVKKPTDRPATSKNLLSNIETELDSLFSKDGVPSNEGTRLTKLLASKAIELYSVSGFDDVGRAKAHPESMASDWEELYKRDQGDNDWNIGSYDFMLDRKKESGKDIVYESARVMRTVMFLMPRLIQDYTYFIRNKWDEAAAREMREGFDVFLDIFVGYLTLLFNSKLIEAKSTSTPEEKLDAKNKLQSYIDEQSPPTKDYLINFVSQYSDSIDDGDFITTRDQKVFVRIQREEDHFSMGENEEVEITENSIKGLLNDPKKHRRQSVWRVAGRMATSLGIRQHLFLNDHARGETPAAGISKYGKYLNIISPVGAANYNSYKDPERPNPFSAHFKLKWRTAQIGEPLPDAINDLPPIEKKLKILKHRVLGSAAKVRSIVLSHEFTKTVLKSGGPLRRHKIETGDISTLYDQIETPYPDPFAFVILAARRREESPQEFEAWDTGLKMFEKFIDVVKGVPGGTLDRKEIAKKDPEKLRAELIAELEKITQDIFSPLKASMDWFRWDHVAQFILLYIDKIYRVYRICDQSDSGVKILNDELRKVLQNKTNNMAGMGQTKYKQTAGGYLVSRGIVAEVLKKDGQDIYKSYVRSDGTIFVPKDKKDGLVKKESQYVSRSSKGIEVRGMPTPRAELPPVSSGSEKDALPDIRDYLLGMIPETMVNAVLVNDALLDPNAIGIMRYRPNFGVPQLLTRGFSSLRMEWMNFRNKRQAIVQRAKVSKALLGLPPADK